ncbi:MAG: sensor histidine kinase [Chloroflexi bacterium]|nr:sensor histidine kinase [Chloroflexota bacterium]
MVTVSHYAGRFKGRNAWLAIAVTISAAAVFMTDISLPLGVSQGALYVIPMTLSLWLPGKYSTPAVAGISVILVITGFFLSPPPSEPLTFVIMNRAYAIFTIGLVLVIERLLRRLSRQNRELSVRTGALEALYEIGTALSALSDTNHIREIAVERACRLLGCDVAALALFSESSDEVHWFFSQAGEERKARSFLSSDKLLKSLEAGAPVIIKDSSRETGDLLAGNALLGGAGLQSALAVPVQIAGKLTGALVIAYRSAQNIEGDSVRLMTALANQVAVAVNNARIYERLKALSTLEERQRLSRELHDGMAQHLGTVSARATAAEELLAQEKPDKAGQQLVRLREASEKAYLDLRQFMLGLRSDISESRSLVDALDKYVKQISQQEKMSIRLEIPDSANIGRLEPAVEVQAIRIIQEALNNALKHSRPKHITVKFNADNGWLTVTVQDDGRGFEMSEVSAAPGHFGLQSMRERAESVGGKLTIDTAIGQGTSVRVMLPIIKVGEQ